MAAPTLADYTWQFGDDGPVMGGGLVFDVQKVAGLDSPPVRVNQQDRDGAHGEFVYAKFYQARAISIEGFIKLPNDTPSPEAYMDSIIGAFAPTDTPQPFYYKTRGIDQRVVFCHAVRLAFDWDEQFNYSYIPFQAQLLAPDPRKYATGTTTFGPVGLGGTSGGRGFPKSYPKAYGTVVIGGGSLVTNPGNIESYPVFAITGPVNNPTLVNENTGVRMQFNISLSSADQLIINTAGQTVELNGTSRIDILAAATMISLVPGENSILFLGNSSLTGGSMQGQFRAAWR